MSVDQVLEILNELRSPEKVLIKVRVHDPVTGEPVLVDCRLVRSAGPGYDNIEIIPTRR
jgi:hypothetical protein